MNVCKRICGISKHEVVSPTLPNWLTEQMHFHHVFFAQTKKSLPFINENHFIRIKGTAYFIIQTKTENLCIVYNRNKIKYD